MSNLLTLKKLLNKAVWTKELNLLTEDTRVEAINSAINTILQQYDIPEYIVSVNIDFTAWVWWVPPRFLRYFSLKDSDNHKYTKVDDDQFDDNVSRT
jgi:hypothetical protein